MQIMEHQREISHIIHDLEQIQTMNYDNPQGLEPLKHSRIMAGNLINEFKALIDTLENEEFDQNQVIYSTEMVETMCMVALYLSRHNPSKLLASDITHGAAINMCSDIIGCSAESLFHMKSLYDSYFTTIEMGKMSEVILNTDMMQCVDQCGDMSETKLGHMCRMRMKMDR